ncbi:MAG: ACP S-malonyltransferase [Hyphomicrobiaceae bacterium]|nr:ACP S-malonyltransferase [Hyphomicrobiaceae bacterium]
MSIAVVFPGQGSQDVGMGKALAERFPAAKAVFDEVDEALGEKLSAIMWEGPKEALTLTQNAQPALMAHSIAVIRVLEAEAGFSLSRDVAYLAGHSLGEYSAHAAADTFTLADTARLLRLRGQAMQTAVPVGQGAMAALLGVDIDKARLIAAAAAQGEVCDVANDNDPGQVVLSGHKTAIDRVQEVGKPHGLRRAVILPVSAPFHCSLMKPAADAMLEALSRVAMSAPVIPVIANITAAPVTNPADIRQLLVDQVTGTVRWRECVMAMAAHGVTTIIEAGAGKVLAGLVKRIDGGISALSVGTPDEIEAVRSLRAA